MRKLKNTLFEFTIPQDFLSGPQVYPVVASAAILKRGQHLSHTKPANFRGTQAYRCLEPLITEQGLTKGLRESANAELS